MRKLINNQYVQELENAVDLTIHTKCPEKWLLIDMETGQQYIGSDKPNLYGKWKRLEEIMLNIVTNKERCYYCEDIAIYNQPGKDGYIISVCKTHFIFAGAS